MTYSKSSSPRKESEAAEKPDGTADESLFMLLTDPIFLMLLAAVGTLIYIIVGRSMSGNWN